MDKLAKLKALIKVLSLWIHDAWHLQIEERKKLEKYERSSTSPQSYEFFKSAAKTYTFMTAKFL